jgi:2,3-bisphosphoglycerate-dependent phosphoglycerate mutase
MSQVARKPLVANKPLTVYLIRHAESENNARPIYDRVCDPPITARGRLQSEHLASWMKTLPLDRLVTSPFRRTLQTAHEILQHRVRCVEVWHDIFESGGCYHGHNETNFRGAEGLTDEEIKRFFEDTRANGDHGRVPVHVDEQISKSGWWAGRPRETIEQTQNRAIAVAERLVQNAVDAGQSIALVIHADFKRELLRVLFKDVLNLDVVGPIANTSVTEIQYDSCWRLGTLNSVTHLPPRLITGREW